MPVASTRTKALSTETQTSLMVRCRSGIDFPEPSEPVGRIVAATAFGFGRAENEISAGRAFPWLLDRDRVSGAITRRRRFIAIGLICAGVNNFCSIVANIEGDLCVMDSDIRT
jgi:hypothetical protein